MRITKRQGRLVLLLGAAIAIFASISLLTPSRTPATVLAAPVSATAPVVRPLEVPPAKPAAAVHPAMAIHPVSPTSAHRSAAAAPAAKHAVERVSLKSINAYSFRCGPRAHDASSIGPITRATPQIMSLAVEPSCARSRCGLQNVEECANRPLSVDAGLTNMSKDTIRFAHGVRIEIFVTRGTVREHFVTERSDVTELRPGQSVDVTRVVGQITSDVSYDISGAADVEILK